MQTNERLELFKTFIDQDFQPHFTPSAYTRWLRPVARKAELGNLVFEYVVREDMLNPAGTLHGGVTAGIIDDLIGATVFTLNEEGHFHPTINLNIDYFAAARLNDTIIAETTIAKRGRQIVNLLCEVWNDDKTKLLARGTSNLMKVPLN